VCGTDDWRYETIIELLRRRQLQMIVKNEVFNENTCSRREESKQVPFVYSPNVLSNLTRNLYYKRTFHAHSIPAILAENHLAARSHWPLGKVTWRHIVSLAGGIEPRDHNKKNEKSSNSWFCCDFQPILRRTEVSKPIHKLSDFLQALAGHWTGQEMGVFSITDGEVRF
jgi:hypothetical protein